MKKRISARGVIIENDEVILMFRKRKTDDGVMKYYVIPGGGIEDNESLEETCIRELKEEFNVDVKILGYLGFEENDKTIFHTFHVKIEKGVPTLGGEELDKNSEDNYYEIKRVNIGDLNNINIYGKEFIIKAKNKEYKEIC